MKGGFTFCGKDIADYGLEYAPENEHTYVYAPAEMEIHEETFEGHNGGYVYGAHYQPKEFILRCVFEEKAIDRGIMSKVFNLFKTGKTGKLVFKRKPWCYYYATVVSNPETEFYNYLNGLITITMKAYYPFARSESCSPVEESEADQIIHAFYNIPTDLYHGDIMANTALFEKKNMVPDMKFTNITPETSGIILLSNPGTVRAQVGVAAMGNAESGVTITNSTTGQECKLIALAKADTTDVDCEVFVDGINGKTLLRGPSGNRPAFLYHDHGFIELEPSYPAIRNIYAQYNNSNEITIVNNLEENVIGKYIFVNNQWLKIVNQEKKKLIVNRNIETEGKERTMICLLNELYIEFTNPDENTILNSLSFIYKPTFA